MSFRAIDQASTLFVSKCKSWHGCLEETFIWQHSLLYFGTRIRRFRMRPEFIHFSYSTRAQSTKVLLSLQERLERYGLYSNVRLVVVRIVHCQRSVSEHTCDSFFCRFDSLTSSSCSNKEVSNAARWTVSLAPNSGSTDCPKPMTNKMWEQSGYSFSIECYVVLGH